MKRQRGRGRNKNNNHGNRQLDSSGPDVKVRGSATQIHDKYVTLARDAASSGNRVKAENYLQHAEHYLRLMNIQEAAKQAAREEAEAARLARGEETSESGDNKSESSDGEERKGRRYPPRARRHNKDQKSGENTPVEASETNTPSEASDKGSENGSEGGEVVELASQDKPKRRRKAPSRKKSEDMDSVDAV